MKIDDRLADEIYAIWTNDEQFREHLGASQIGRPCDREIWYGFRWAKSQQFDGRMQRLFDRGKREEGVVIGDLIAAGMEIESEITNPDGKQTSFSDLGHFGGSVDAIGFIGKNKFLIEIKTANDKSWTHLHKNGVAKSKQIHYCQMQVYMGELDLTKGLYVSVNKNTDHIHCEWINFCRDDYIALRQRAREIIYSTYPPDRLSNNPAHYQCKLCSYYDICHGDQPVDRNCRTCHNSEPQEDGRWWCHKHKRALDKQAQLDGCDDYQCIADAMPF